MSAGWRPTHTSLNELKTAVTTIRNCAAASPGQLSARSKETSELEELEFILFYLSTNILSMVVGSWILSQQSLGERQFKQ